MLWLVQLTSWLVMWVPCSLARQNALGMSMGRSPGGMGVSTNVSAIVNKRKPQSR
jgi:hypothetical protein